MGNLGIQEVKTFAQSMLQIGEQLEKNEITMGHLQSFIEHKNPFEVKQNEKNAGEKFEYPRLFSPKTIQEQYELVWRHILPNRSLNFEELETFVNHSDAEGWLIIPSIKCFYVSGMYAVSFYRVYNEALRVLLEEAAKRYRIATEIRERLNSKYCQLNYRTYSVLHELETSINGCFYAFPLQFGKRYRWITVKDVKQNFECTEFGLCLYMVLCLLLTHPELIIGQNGFNIECSGLNYREMPSGKFDQNLTLEWLEKDNKIHINSYSKFVSTPRNLTPTGFSPFGKAFVHP